MKKIVEQSLPLHNLNLSSIADSVKTGHPGCLHLWWHRSPIVSSKAILYSALTDIPEDSENKDKEKISEIANGQSCQIQHDDYPVVLDPFSGFGGLAIASQQLGLKTKAVDLNSVATLLTKAATEFTSWFRDTAAVNPGVIRGVIIGAQGIASDVQYYGGMLCERLKAKLSEIYPLYNCQEVYSWIWVRTVECANPACKREVPLSSSYVLSKKKNAEYWAEPILENDRLKFLVHKGKCPSDREVNKVGTQGARFVCPFCGELNREEHIKSMGQAHKLGKNY